MRQRDTKDITVCMLLLQLCSPKQADFKNMSICNIWSFLAHSLHHILDWFVLVFFKSILTNCWQKVTFAVLCPYVWYLYGILYNWYGAYSHSVWIRSHEWCELHRDKFKRHDVVSLVNTNIKKHNQFMFKKKPQQDCYNLWLTVACCADWRTGSIPQCALWAIVRL